MSEVRLNIIDAHRAIHGTIHGSAAEAAIAALSAEPETIAELEAALARFIKPVNDSRPFAWFRIGTNVEPWDAGIVIVDLAARVAAAESSYSSPSAQGNIQYHDGTRATDVWLPYRVPDDWLFVYSIAEYEAVREQRRAERAAVPPLDARPVLYGAVTEFSVQECLAARDANADDPIAEIHAKWLMTPRDDLRRQSPRDVMLAKLEFIDFDLHSRELQWSFVGEAPPCLPRDSAAYRFAGFGTPEVVLYYELLRLLLWECWKRVSEEANVPVADEVARLERIKADWLERPQSDFSGKRPAYIIECERRRLPLAMSAKEALIDDDCPLCQIMGEEMTPMFWHLDGCNMDDDFPFSFYRTRAEWEEEERRQQEFNAEFNRQWQQRQGKDFDNEWRLDDDDASDVIH
jgi:hypothetical protein